MFFADSDDEDIYTHSPESSMVQHEGNIQDESDVDESSKLLQKHDLKVATDIAMLNKVSNVVSLPGQIRNSEMYNDFVFTQSPKKKASQEHDVGAKQDDPKKARKRKAELDTGVKYKKEKKKKKKHDKEKKLQNKEAKVNGVGTDKPIENVNKDVVKKKKHKKEKSKNEEHKKKRPSITNIEFVNPPAPQVAICQIAERTESADSVKSDATYSSLDSTKLQQMITYLDSVDKVDVTSVTEEDTVDTKNKTVIAEQQEDNDAIVADIINESIANLSNLFKERHRVSPTKKKKKKLDKKSKLSLIKNKSNDSVSKERDSILPTESKEETSDRTISTKKSKLSLKKNKSIDSVSQECNAIPPTECKEIKRDKSPSPTKSKLSLIKNKSTVSVSKKRDSIPLTEIKEEKHEKSTSPKKSKLSLNKSEPIDLIDNKTTETNVHTSIETRPKQNVVALVEKKVTTPSTSKTKPSKRPSTTPKDGKTPTKSKDTTGDSDKNNAKSPENTRTMDMALESLMEGLMQMDATFDSDSDSPLQTPVQSFKGNGKKRSAKNNDESLDLDRTDLGSEVTDDDVTILAHLSVELPFQIANLHRIETRITAGPTKEQQIQIELLQLDIKKGSYTSDEDTILKENWILFCRHHNLPPKPELFVRFTHEVAGDKPVVDICERIKFVQFLAHGLSNRLLHSVYKRFQTIFGVYKRGKFTEEEDNFILDVMSSTKSRRHVFARIASELNRDRLSVEKRYIYLQDEAKHKYTNERISAKEGSMIIDKLITGMGCKGVNGLKDKTISACTFQKIGTEMGIRPLRLSQYWYVNMHPKLFVTGTRTIWKIKKRLLELIIANDEIQSLRDIDYNKLVIHMDGWTTYALNKILINLIHNNSIRRSRAAHLNTLSFQAKLIEIKKWILDDSQKDSQKKLKTAKYIDGELSISD